MRPYLKTGEFKEMKDGFLITYQFYFCVNCREIHSKQHDKYKVKEIKDGTDSAKKQVGSGNTGGTGKSVQNRKQHGGSASKTSAD